MRRLIDDMIDFIVNHTWWFVGGMVTVMVVLITWW